MESWESHVRAELFHRDCRQRDPFSGLFDKGEILLQLLANVEKQAIIIALVMTGCSDSVQAGGDAGLSHETLARHMQVSVIGERYRVRSHPPCAADKPTESKTQRPPP